MAKGTPGFFDVDERLAELSAKGDDLERVTARVDFEIFRAVLEAAVLSSDRSMGGRPPFDHVFMRFLGLGLADAVPDANTIWMFRECAKKGERGRRLVATIRRWRCGMPALWR